MASWLLLAFLSTTAALIPRQTTGTTNALTCTPTYGSATNGIATAYCACGNGFTQPLAPSTNPTSYDPCPPTQMSVASPTQTTQAQWAYTTTESGGITVECQSASYMGEGGTTFPLCGGSTQTLQPSKSPSVLIDVASGTSTYAGSLSGTALSMAVTSALTNVCKISGTAGAPTCTSTAYIGDLYYPDESSGTGESKGELELIIGKANFSDADMMDKMIRTMGAAIAQWASQSGACGNLTFDIPELHGGVHPEKRWECFVPGSVIVQYFSGTNVYGADDVLWIDARFQGAPGASDITDDICQDIMTAVSIVDAIAAIFFPPVAAVAAEVGAAVDIVCDAIEQFHSVTSALGH